MRFTSRCSRARCSNSGCWRKRPRPAGVGGWSSGARCPAPVGALRKRKIRQQQVRKDPWPVAFTAHFLVLDSPRNQEQCCCDHRWYRNRRTAVTCLSTNARQGERATYTKNHGIGVALLEDHSSLRNEDIWRFYYQ